jgi:hypothetical protein
MHRSTVGSHGVERLPRLRRLARRQRGYARVVERDEPEPTADDETLASGGALDDTTGPVGGAREDAGAIDVGAAPGADNDLDDA